MRAVKCPACGSKNVRPIMYGLPTSEALASARRGEIVIGGCCVTDKSPHYVCFDCNKEFKTLLSRLLYRIL